MRFSKDLIFSVALHIAMFAFALMLASIGIHGLMQRDYHMVSLVSEQEGEKEQTTHEDAGSHRNNSSLMKKHLVQPAEKQVVKSERSLSLPNSGPGTGDQPQTSKIKAPPQSIPASAGFSLEPLEGKGAIEKATPVSGSPLVYGGKETGLKKNSGNLESVASRTCSADLIGKIRASIQEALVYPVLARRRGMEGTVTVQFQINNSGIPGGIKIIRNSGFAILDSAAKESILKAGPLPSVNGTVEIPITFRLNKVQ